MLTRKQPPQNYYSDNKTEGTRNKKAQQVFQQAKSAGKPRKMRNAQAIVSGAKGQSRGRAREGAEIRRPGG